MAKLIYVTPVSLDGYIADEARDYEVSTPDEEEFAFITDVIRPIGTYLYGRKMYQTMAIWQTPELIPGQWPGKQDFARPGKRPIRSSIPNRWRASLLPRRG